MIAPDLHIFVIICAGILLLDFFILTGIRKLRLPDFIAHLLAGICWNLLVMGVAYVYPEAAIPLPLQNSSLFRVLVEVGLFLFFLEMGFRFYPGILSDSSHYEYRESGMFSGLVILVVFAASPLLIKQGWQLTYLVFTPIALLAPDIGSLLTNRPLQPENLRTHYFEFVRFTAFQEFWAICFFGVFILSINFNPGAIGLPFYGLLAGAALLVWMLSSPAGKRRETRAPLFLVQIALLSIIVSICLKLGLTTILTGFGSGMVVRIFSARNKKSVNEAVFTPGRFFIIFPLIQIGWECGLFLSWQSIIIHLLYLIIVLSIVAFLMGLFWMRNQQEYLISSIALLNRGELSLFILLWGHQHQVVYGSLLPAAVLIFILMHLLARAGVLRKVEATG